MSASDSDDVSGPVETDELMSPLKRPTGPSGASHVKRPLNTKPAPRRPNPIDDMDVDDELDFHTVTEAKRPNPANRAPKRPVATDNNFFEEDDVPMAQNSGVDEAEDSGEWQDSAPAPSKAAHHAASKRVLSSSENTKKRKTFSDEEDVAESAELSDADLAPAKKRPKLTGAVKPAEPAAPAPTKKPAEKPQTAMTVKKTPQPKPAVIAQPTKQQKRVVHDEEEHEEHDHETEAAQPEKQEEEIAAHQGYESEEAIGTVPQKKKPVVQPLHSATGSKQAKQSSSASAPPASPKKASSSSTAPAPSSKKPVAEQSEEEPEKPAPKRSQAPVRKPAKPREPEPEHESEHEETDDDAMDVEEAPKPAKKSAARTSAPATKAKAPARAKKTASKKDESDDENDADTYEEEKPKKAKQPKSTKTTKAKTSTKPREKGPGPAFKIVMAYSGLNDEQKDSIADIAKLPRDSALYAQVVDEITSDCTHLVVGHKPARTWKVLKAIARGIWVMDFSWIYESISAEAWVSPTKFESKAFKGANRSRRLHAEMKDNENAELLLAGKKILLGGKTQPPRENLIELIHDLGGLTVTGAGACDYVVAAPGAVELSDKTIEKPVVSVEWLLDAVSHYEIPDTKLYKPGSPPPRSSPSKPKSSSSSDATTATVPASAQVPKKPAKKSAAPPTKPSKKYPSDDEEYNSGDQDDDADYN